MTTDQIQALYDRAFAKLKTLNGRQYWLYADICQRILNYKHREINRKYSHLN